MVLHFQKLRLSLLALVLLVIVPSMILLIVYTSWEQRRNSRVQAQQTALRLAQVAALEQERLLTNTHHLLVTLAELAEVRERRADDCNETFAKIMKRFPYYTNIAAVAADGDIFCTGSPNRKVVNIADRPYFQAAIRERRLAISPFLFGRVTGKPNITVVYPHFNAAGTVRGVVFADLDLAWLNAMAAKVKMPRRSIFLALDDQGAVFARHPEPDKWLGKKADPQLVKTIVERQEGLTEAEDADGRRLYGFATLYRFAEHGALYVAVGIPDAVAFADSNRTFYRSLIVLLAVCLLAAVSTWFGAHLLVRRRLEDLVTAARALGEIGIEQSASTSPQFLRRRVGQYAQVLEEMWESLNKIITRQADFSAMIAHDLRNPVHTIKMTAAVLTQDEQLGKSQKHLLDIIQNSSDELANIIKEFMDFSKFKAGYLRLEKSEVSVKDVILGVKQKYSLLSTNRQLQLITAVEPRIGTMYVDRQKIEQLVGNLVANALKFTPSGGKIEIGARGITAGVELWVKDSGIGIAAGEIQNLFSKYQQTASGKKSQEEGTGLGLLICKMIAESHGGRIWVESQLNKGTTFFVWLPGAAESYRPTGT